MDRTSLSITVLALRGMTVALARTRRFAAAALLVACGLPHVLFAQQTAMGLHEYRQLRAARAAAIEAKKRADFSRARNGAVETMAAQKLTDAKAEADAFQCQLVANSEERLEIERRLEDSQGSNSLLAKARQKRESRLDTVNHHRDRLGNDPERMKRDADYQRALLEYQAARTLYGRLQNDLFSADENWRINVADARELKRELKQLNEQIETRSVQKSRSASQRRIAEKKSAAASATLDYTQKRGFPRASTTPPPSSPTNSR